jgi:hypothetical protein
VQVSQPPPKDDRMLAVFHERDGQPTRVVLSNGRELIAYTIAWGYDMGDEYSHVTTNASPFVEGAPLNFFVTSEVDQLVDPDEGVVLFVWH